MQKMTFFNSTLTSQSPFELIYYDVWAPILVNHVMDLKIMSLSYISLQNIYGCIC